MIVNPRDVNKPAALSTAEISKNIIEACLDTKGNNLVALDVSEIFDMAEQFIIVSGRSDRQVQGIASRIMSVLAAHGVEPGSIEGFDQGHWILLDYDDVVVHIFFEPVRYHYDLEGLWFRGKRVDLTETATRPAVAA